jgi:hypothetical protein
MLNWDSFFTAEAGASASLAGLIFVGLSINLKQIVALSRLPERAIQALVVLLMVLVVSLLFLVPGQSLVEIGLEVLAIGLIGWAVNTFLAIRNTRATPKQYRGQYLQVELLDQLSILLYVAAGIGILIFSDSGIYLLVPATILSFLKSIIDAWVLLIEINR